MSSADRDGTGRRLLASLSLCAILIGCKRGGSSQEPAPLLDTTSRDLGAIRLDADYESTFRISNTTDAPITITRIRSSCGCVAAGFDPAPIPPGQQREITLKLNTHGQTVLGPIVKHATIEFESGPPVQLELRARLDSDFEIEPRRVEFSADERSHEIRLTRRQLDSTSFAKLVLVGNADCYDVAEDSGKQTADLRVFRVTMKEASAGATLPELYFSDSASGRPLPFATVTCSRKGPTLRPSSFTVNARAGAPPKAAVRFRFVDFQSQPMRMVSVQPFDELSKRLLVIGFDPERDAKSFTLALAENSDLPDETLTRLMVSVDFTSLDQRTSGRLLLPCFLLGTGKSEKAEATTPPAAESAN
ncbi:hypothetical protein Pan44_50230 [Caulifigura coniformis]|uniref:DUF1573 domain-containing protein n=1 Tax=Caulifigura coniformis TaxID=2527983 RepID=A0A517SLG7_9PLAN|nr:DUF1573 domain-containing protein [Caulifigura coniformis]QDT56960.1 hypothetical protein Pan44_50230 [Caulifigura coniformis]